MKLRYMCLDSVLDKPSYFEVGFFDCAALGFSYVVNLEMDNSLKWVLFNIVSCQITSDTLWN